MKTFSMTVALAAPLLAAAQHPHHGEYARRAYGMGPRGFGMMGFGCGYYDEDTCGPWGGDGCARSCFSSYWETATPTPTAFCDGGSELHDCIEAACTEDADKMSTYSSRSSSLCSVYSSCDSTGTYTYTYQTPEGEWPGGRFGGTRTWPTGEVVVTGCPWNGDGWGFPFWGGLGYGSDFWNTLGPGWRHATVTTTVTAGATSAVVTLEQAVSGDVSTFRTIGLEAAETGSSSSDDSPSAANGNLKEVQVMGAALGVVVAVAGML